MFLQELNEEEKKLFWVIANAVVMADGTKTEQETELLKQYLVELDAEFDVLSPNAINIEDEIQKLKNCDVRIRRIFCFELCGLVNADSDYSKEEKEMIHHICNKMEISEETLGKMEECVQEIYDAYKKLGEILNA